MVKVKQNAGQVYRIAKLVAEVMVAYMYMCGRSASKFDEVSEIGLFSGLAAGGVGLLLLSVTVGFFYVKHRRNSRHTDQRYLSYCHG